MTRDLQEPVTTPKPTPNIMVHFGPRFHNWTQELQARQRSNSDNVIVIDGYEGTGKSNLATLLATCLDPGFDAENVIFTTQDWNHVFDTNQTGKSYLVDEAGNLLFSRDYASNDSKFLVKLLMQARILRSTIIMCLPNMHFLDRYVRESRIKYRVHMLSRHSAIVQDSVTNWRTGTTMLTDRFKITNIPSAAKLLGPVWTRYEERKVAAVRSFSGDHQQMLREKKLSQAARIKRLEAELDR